MNLSDYSDYYVIIGNKTQDYYENIQTESKILECIRSKDNLFEGHAKYYRFHERSGSLHIEVTDIVKSLPIQVQHNCNDNNEDKDEGEDEDKDEEKKITFIDGRIEKGTLICCKELGDGDFNIGELAILENSGAKKSEYYYTNTKNHILILPVELYQKYKNFQDILKNDAVARDLLLCNIIAMEKKLAAIENALYGKIVNHRDISDSNIEYNDYNITEIFNKIYCKKLLVKDESLNWID